MLRNRHGEMNWKPKCHGKFFTSASDSVAAVVMWIMTHFFPNNYLFLNDAEYDMKNYA